MAKQATSQNSSKRVSKHRVSKQLAKKPTARKRKKPLSASSSYTVFISHSSKVSWIARQIKKEIEGAGLKTWIDDAGLHGGDEIESTIKSGIHETQEVLVVFSTNSIMSQWVF